MKKKAVSLLFSCMLAVSAMSPSVYAEGEKVLDAALAEDITTLDVMGTSNDYLVPMNIYDRLFEVNVLEDGSTEIVGSLCTDYAVSDDGLTYTFTLKDGVKFSNGEDFTAEDVEYTFMHLLSPESQNADIALEVKGAQQYMDGEADKICVRTAAN